MLRGSLWRLLAVAVAVPAATRAVAALKAGRSLHRDFDDGRVVELALDRETGSRLESKDRYLFGRFDLDIRLVADESAGTITSFYEGSSGCEPGGGSARPSHGAAAADSLPASFVFMWICMWLGAAIKPVTAARCSSPQITFRSEKEDEQENPIEEFGEEQELSESDAVNRATERKCGGDEMGTEDPAAMLFLCSPAQGLLSRSQKGKTTLLCFLENLPIESLPQQRQICDQGYIRWIFKQNLEAIFPDSLVLSWLFCRDCSSVHFLVTVYCSSATVQQLTLWFLAALSSSSCYLVAATWTVVIYYILIFSLLKQGPF